MFSYIGQKRNVKIGQRFVPGVIATEPISTTVEVPRPDGSVRKFPALLAEIITLRETNPDNGPVTQYYMQTPENLRFATIRSSHVVGLDGTKDGEKLGLDALSQLVEASMLARDAQRAAQSAEVEIDLDDTEVEPDTEVELDS